MITRARITVGLLAVLAVLPACSAPPSTGGVTPGGTTPGQQVWRTDGYGLVYALDGPQLKIYEITGAGCIPAQTLQQTEAPATDGTLRFGEGGATTQTLRTGPASAGPAADGASSAGGPATVHLVGTAADMDLKPLPGLPESCTRQVAPDPLSTFDVFWSTFAENYNSFGRKSVDWAATRDLYRPRVSVDTEPEQLFTILQAMIEPFGDAHTSIATTEGDEFFGLRTGTRDLSEDPDLVDAMDEHLSRLGVTDLHRYANGKISYAALPDGRGYLRINTFDGYRKNDSSSAASAAELARVLDSVFTQQSVNSMRGLVIDLRLNSGGDDALALQVAGRLADRSYPAFTKAARNDPNDITRHGRAQQVTVTPAAGARYTGPVWLLTSDSTLSAGETFIEAMMGRTPAPVRVGATTQGVFSDDMSRRLPNGWTFTLGNEEYTASDGHNYEGEGIPPTVPTPVFTEAEMAAGQDSALDNSH